MRQKLYDKNNVVFIVPGKEMHLYTLQRLKAQIEIFVFFLSWHFCSLQMCDYSIIKGFLSFFFNYLFICFQTLIGLNALPLY